MKMEMAEERGRNTVCKLYTKYIARTETTFSETGAFDSQSLLCFEHSGQFLCSMALSCDSEVLLFVLNTYFVF